MNSAEDSFSNIWSGLLASHKTQIFNFSGNLYSDPYVFINALIGGIFLSFSSHGVDYMMVQRVLSVKNLKIWAKGYDRKWNFCSNTVWDLSICWSNDLLLFQWGTNK